MIFCGIGTIAKIYKRYSVALTGSKGTGKDMLQGNVINKRALPYVSNVDYKCHNKKSVYHPLDFSRIDCGKNNYVNFIKGDVNYYDYTYPEKADIYISDAGVYLPSQYNGELNRDYKYVPTFLALSRQLGDCYEHYNTQAYGRVWDKVREQCDYYIRTRRCIVIGRLVLCWLTLYDTAEACERRVRPCRVRVPLLNKEAQTQAEIALDNYRNTHGLVQDKLCIFINRTDYDTRLFKEMLKNGKKKDI